MSPGPDPYDLVVVGAGAAGLAAARTGARARVRVALVTDGEPGGDCTFTGCVPSKTLIEMAARGAGFGAAMAAVRAAVTRIAGGEDTAALGREGITVVRGRAAFTGPDAITVNGRQLRAPRCVVATGTRPAPPPIAGLAEVPHLTNETVFDLADAPASLAVLGAGAVGCELAQAFARLGAAVTVMEAEERLLPAADPEASATLARAFAADGIVVHAGAAVRSVERTGAGVCLRLADGGEVRAERLLIAAGRAPDTGGLGLDAAGVRTDGDGRIVTDDRLATTAPGVYAAGDVTGRMPFTHAADAMGRLAAGNALKRRGRARFSASAIPWVVFTGPEIAQVGMTETEAARAYGGRARVAYLPMADVDRAITAGQEEGFVKLVAGPRRLLGTTGGGRVVGATIAAARAGEMIHEPVLAMRTGMFTGRLAQTTHAYPTWSVAVQQTAAQFFGRYGGRTARAAR